MFCEIEVISLCHNWYIVIFMSSKNIILNSINVSKKQNQENQLCFDRILIKIGLSIDLKWFLCPILKLQILDFHELLLIK